MSESTDLKTLQQELQQALSLINDYSATHNDTSKAVLDTDGLNNTQSLLERCAAVVNANSGNTKPTLRIIHHFACSGGTLISKCLAAQPNVFLLSELHPTTRLGMNMEKAAYTPRDITTQAIYGRVPNVDELAEKLFVNGIIETEKHIRERGGYLVIRAHTHADYCTESHIPEVDTLTRLLQPNFEIKHLVTVRNPIDTYLSLNENGWINSNIKDFDKYCSRFLRFINSFNLKEIVKYEDFVTAPDNIIKFCCNILELKSTTLSLGYFDISKVSGDSGRGSCFIEKRTRRSISEQLLKEYQSAEFYSEIAKKLGY